jgi:flagellar biosynthesis protein FlhB
MADSDDNEKSQDPSQKRLDEAIRRGDVVKSQEVNAWFVTAASALVLLSFASPAAGNLKTLLGTLVANAAQVADDGHAFYGLLRHVGAQVFAAVAMPLLLLALAAIGGNIVQHRPVWSVDPVLPQLARISPLAGAKRLFSRRALMGFAKGLAKLAIVGATFTILMWPERRRFEAMAMLDPAALLPLARTLALKLFGTVVAILALVAAVDYLFEYRLWFERHKMSPRELREELKESEGDPKIKARIKQLRAGRAKKRMMAAVKKATVVITNPTHFAVALQYDRGMAAPVCVAKGVDFLAVRIREIAEAHNVAVIHNPPLARALHAAVDVDEAIPAEHYKAVAEVIGYVMRLNGALHR